MKPGVSASEMPTPGSTLMGVHARLFSAASGVAATSEAFGEAKDKTLAAPSVAGAAAVVAGHGVEAASSESSLLIKKRMRNLNRANGSAERAYGKVAMHIETCLATLQAVSALHDVSERPRCVRQAHRWHSSVVPLTDTGCPNPWWWEEEAQPSWVVLTLIAVTRSQCS